jgi:hypothetical protein
MFMFTDAILLMSKSCHHNDTVDQQKWGRHLRPWKSIHHRFVEHRGQPFTFTFHVVEDLRELRCCVFVLTSPIWIHWEIALVIRVMEVTLQNRRTSSKWHRDYMVLLYIFVTLTTTHLHPHYSSWQSSETPTSSSFPFDNILGCDCDTVFVLCSDPSYIDVCVYVCIYMEGYHILLYI